MVIEALTELYNTMAEQGIVCAPGWTSAKVTYGLHIDNDGMVKALIPLATVEKPAGKNKTKTVVVPAYINVPEQLKRSSNVLPYLFCDTAVYLLGLEKDDKNETEKFTASKKYHLDFLKNVDSEAATAVTAFFRNWNPETIWDYPFFLDHQKELTTSKLIFIHNGCPVTEDNAIRDKCEQVFSLRESRSKNISCMVTGNREPAAGLHPNIMNVYGGSSMGQPLVSFNLDAALSYKQTKETCAVMGKHTVYAYTTALNELLRNTSNVRVLGDTTVVCWTKDYNGETNRCILQYMFGEPVEHEEILENVCENEPFYILGVAPNAGRLKIKFFYESSFGSMRENVEKFQEELRIVKPVFETDENISMWKLLKETVFNGSKDVSATPRLAADMEKSVFLGYKYPVELYQNVLSRIYREKAVTYRKAAIIKAYLVRNGKNVKRGTLMAELNEECKDIPYTMGRLFALLEELQERAIDGVTTTITKRYFSNASILPGQTYPILLDLAGHHLRKIKKISVKTYFEKEIEKMLQVIGPKFPIRFTQEEKGSFMLGYYCQKQKRFEKKLVNDVK